MKKWLLVLALLTQLGARPFVAPSPTANPCPTHSNTTWHGVWDSARGCYYDHEHGDNPFTSAVSSTFAPLGKLRALQGGKEVGHTAPSGDAEVNHKHGGSKYTVALGLACQPGFEGATYGVKDLVVQYHAFGNYLDELGSRIHSSSVMVKQCVSGSTDYGYLYTVQWQDFGQMLYDYQGEVMPFPNRPQPYPSGLGQYWAWQSVNRGSSKCGTRDVILMVNCNVATTFTSKGGHVPQQTVFTFLGRARDLPMTVDYRDQSYPFTAEWLCSTTGGALFESVRGCRYNNSTTRVHEVRFLVPASWDNQPFDSDTRTGRITARIYTDRMGAYNPSCFGPSSSCFLVKMVQAYVGHTGAVLTPKDMQFSFTGLPERDVYFCGSVVCAETSPGAVSSGWIGPNN